MTTLAKSHKEYINQMIKENQSVDQFQSYCKGAGIDTTKYSSPIHIGKDNKISIRYRGEMSYHFARS
jgi:hypothetical protein